MRSALSYLRWLAFPALLFAAGLALPGGRTGAPVDERPMHPQLRLVDKKVRRTVRLHEAADPGGEPPLFTVNRPGLAVDLAIDPGTYRMMLYKKNRKDFTTRATNASVRFAGRRPVPATIALRGAGTLKADLPSFKVRLFRKVKIAEKIAIKRFYLMSLLEDSHNVETVVGYRLLAELGLYHCHYQFVAMSVNGEAQGVYLLIEPPRNAIRRVAPRTVAVHRRKKANIYKTYWADSVPDVGATLSRLRDLGYSERIDRPVARFRRVLDLDGYLRWTALNALLYNRDTLDELWLYEVREDKGRPAPLRVMGWDYDNSLYDEPKGGITDALFYSCQGKLDARIAEHPALRALYRQTLNELLRTRLALAHVLGVLRAVVAERDAIDDGRPAEIQRVARTSRREALAVWVRLLTERHAQLLKASSR